MISQRYGRLATVALYMYALCVVCPIRYWPLGDNIDQTWRFGLNYAHAQGLRPGTQVLFTSGPLGFLTFPEHVGSNLGQGLIFQAVLWLGLAAVLGDLFFHTGVALRNLALFSVLLGMAADLFWFDFLGLENLMLAAAMVLLVVFAFRGGVTRFWGAAAVIGSLAFIKLTAGMIGFTALFGFLIARVLELRWRAWREVSMGIVIPAVVAAGISVLTMPSWGALAAYLRGSLEISAGFSSAMARKGPPLQLAAAGLAVMVLAGMVWLVGQKGARFYALLLVMPIFVAFKHGFVRQDALHVNGFFCFMALLLALVVLNLNLQQASGRRALFMVGVFGLLWAFNVQSFPRTAAESTGLRGLWMAAGAIPLGRLERHLDDASAAFPEESQLEPEVIRAIGESPVASLSIQFSNMRAANLHVKIYPVLQRYSAYTRYLDGLDAAWIRDSGPRFLVFDGDRIDGRDAWAETPATWLEVYRWYDTRLLGMRNLLLERRATPRFSSLEKRAHVGVKLPGGFRLPSTSEAIFWELRCEGSAGESIKTILLRAPVMMMRVHQVKGSVRRARVIPAVLVSPSLGNFLPGSLAQYAEVFQSAVQKSNVVDEIRFDDGSSRSCEVDLLSPAPTSRLGSEQ